MVSYILHATISVFYQFVYYKCTYRLASQTLPFRSVDLLHMHVPILKAIGTVERKGSGLRDLNALGWNLREVPLE